MSMLYGTGDCMDNRQYRPTNEVDQSLDAGTLQIFTAPCAIVQSAVLRLHVVRRSVCDVGGSGPHRPRLEILETNKHG